MSSSHSIAHRRLALPGNKAPVAVSHSTHLHPRTHTHSLSLSTVSLFHFSLSLRNCRYQSSTANHLRGNLLIFFVFFALLVGSIPLCRSPPPWILFVPSSSRVPSNSAKCQHPAPLPLQLPVSARPSPSRADPLHAAELRIRVSMLPLRSGVGPACVCLFPQKPGRRKINQQPPWYDTVPFSFFYR